MKYKKLKEELLDLIIAIDVNANAYDDDLPETWEVLKAQIEKATKNLDKYVQEGEK